MQHDKSRSEKREDRYASLREKGQSKTVDYLYSSEIRKLEKTGHEVTKLTTHPVNKSLFFCEIIFPQENT